MFDMSVYETKRIRLEKIEIERKLYNDLYTKGLIIEEDYEAYIRELIKELSYI